MQVGNESARDGPKHTASFVLKAAVGELGERIHPTFVCSSPHRGAPYRVVRASPSRQRRAFFIHRQGLVSILPCAPGTSPSPHRNFVQPKNISHSSLTRQCPRLALCRAYTLTSEAPRSPSRTPAMIVSAPLLHLLLHFHCHPAPQPAAVAMQRGGGGREYERWRRVVDKISLQALRTRTISRSVPTKSATRAPLTWHRSPPPLPTHLPPTITILPPSRLPASRIRPIPVLCVTLIFGAAGAVCRGQGEPQRLRWQRAQRGGRDHPQEVFMQRRKAADYHRVLLGQEARGRRQACCCRRRRPSCGRQG